jgi:hypothetical protein
MIQHHCSMDYWVSLSELSIQSHVSEEPDG